MRAHGYTGRGVGGVLAVCLCGETVMDTWWDHFREYDVLPRVFKGEDSMPPGTPPERQRPWKARIPELGQPTNHHTWAEAMEYATMTPAARKRQLDEDFYEGGW